MSQATPAPSSSLLPCELRLIAADKRALARSLRTQAEYADDPRACREERARAAALDIEAADLMRRADLAEQGL